MVKPSKYILRGLEIVLGLVDLCIVALLVRSFKGLEVIQGQTESQVQGILCLWDILHNKTDLLYSWGTGLGQSTLDILLQGRVLTPSYVIGCLLVPRQGVVGLLNNIEMFKIALCTLTMFYCLVKSETQQVWTHHKELERCVNSLVFGFLYGILVLRLYKVHWCSIWKYISLDCLIALPLLPVFLDQLRREGKVLRLVCLLVYTTLADIHNGLVLGCIISPIYILVNTLVECGQYKFGVLRQLGVICLGIGVTAVVTVPCLNDIKDVTPSEQKNITEVTEYGTDYTKGVYRVSYLSNNSIQGQVDNSKTISGIYTNTGLAGTLNKLGYTLDSRTGKITTPNPIPIADDMLGVRFYLDLGNCKTEHAMLNTVFNRAESVYGSSKESISSGITVNPHTLSLGYVVPSTLQNWDISTDNAYRTYNDLSSRLVDRQVYRAITKHMLQDETQVEVPSTGNLALQFKGLSEQITVYVTVQALPTEAEQAEGEQLKPTQKIYGVKASANSLCYIADLQPGTIAYIRPQSTVSGNAEIHTAGLDLDVYKQVIDRLSKSQLQRVLYSPRQIDGELNSIEDGILLTSIPYTQNGSWWVYVDGIRKKPHAMLNNSMLSVPITKGTHYIRLEYHNTGMLLGSVLSISSICLLGLFTLIDEAYPSHRKTKSTRKTQGS